VRVTGTLGNEIQVDFVGKTSATEEATAMRRQRRRTRNRRKRTQTTPGMRAGTLRDEGDDGVVEIDGDNTVITQRVIGGKTESIHRMDDTMTLPKFQKNSTERRKTNPTSTDSIDMFFGKVGITVRVDDERFDIVPNKRPKMRRNFDERNPMKRRDRPVKLEIAANNYTESILTPDETGRTIKSALIFSKKLLSHFFLNVEHT